MCGRWANNSTPNLARFNPQQLFANAKMKNIDF